MKERAIGIDFVKFLACLFVIGVHFFAHTKFSTTPIVGKTMFAQLSLRWLFFTCVPLFMIVTGYLQNKKTLCKKHYMGLIPIVPSYLFIAIICILYRHYYLNVHMGIVAMIVSTLNFSADPYGWYVEMFVGMFLLIPFLNIIYHHLQDKKQKLILIGTLLFLCSGTSLFSSFTINGTKLDISTDWWLNLYPILYYFIGAYIQEYQVRINKAINVILIAALVLLEAVLSKAIFGAYFKNVFNSGIFGQYNAMFTVAIATLLFLLFYQMDIRAKAVRFVISNVARHTLEIYLISYIFDTIYYPIFLKNYYHTQMGFGIYGLILVPLILLSSLVAANAKELIFTSAQRLYKVVRPIWSKTGKEIGL